MKHLKILAFAATILAAATLAFSACSDDEGVDRTVTPESGLELSPSLVNFGVNGGTQSVTVTETKGSVSWEPIISGDNGSWLTVTKTGSGVEITAASNAGNIEGRSASIAISDVNITVTQDWDTSIPAFWINNTNFSVSSGAQEITITTARQAITSYVITSGVSWFSVSESGTDIIVSVQENTDQKRTDTFEVSAAGTTEVVRITISQGKSADLGYAPIFFEGTLNYLLQGTPVLSNQAASVTGRFTNERDVALTDRVTGASDVFSYLYMLNDFDGGGNPFYMFYSSVEVGVCVMPFHYAVYNFEGIPTPCGVRSVFLNDDTGISQDDYTLEYDPETKTFSGSSYNGSLIIIGAGVYSVDTGEFLGWFSSAFVNFTIALSEVTGAPVITSYETVNPADYGYRVFTQDDIIQ